jgi:hypothetical protein
MGRSGAAGLLAALALAAAAPAAAQSPASQGVLRAEFWVEVEPVAAPGEEWPLSLDTAVRRLLEEAAWVYSGLVWGYEFSYTPLDRVRALQERFELRSLGSIAAGDPALVPGGPTGLPDQVRAWIDYRPDAASIQLMESYSREPWKAAQGIGRADRILGWPGRRAAYEDAAREAVRDLMRSLEPNKPRLVRGRLAFERVPSIALRGGMYTVQARIRVTVLEALPYTVY